MIKQLNKNEGFLLLEALIGISILVAGVFVISESFSQTRTALLNGKTQSTLASCFEEELLNQQTGITIKSNCSEMFSINKSDTQITPSMKKTLWTLTSRDNGQPYEEIFETISLS